ncbi:MAG: transposase [bacterium LCO1.1]|uniref:Transposase n=1 Tax=Candidatus Weimeria bifida TaxID=2599074 RepID=A0A6N7IXC7_9FIRM|nr:transposase [Candidatus Weimeria bifida]
MIQNTDRTLSGACLADQIYRTRENRKFCKENGIRLSGPKLGRPSKELSAEEKHIEYKDNTDRIEVERASASARDATVWTLKTKLEETSYAL